MFCCHSQLPSRLFRPLKSPLFCGRLTILALPPFLPLSLFIPSLLESCTLCSPPLSVHQLLPLILTLRLFFLSTFFPPPCLLSVTQMSSVRYPSGDRMQTESVETCLGTSCMSGSKFQSFSPKQSFLSRHVELATAKRLSGPREFSGKEVFLSENICMCSATSKHPGQPCNQPYSEWEDAHFKAGKKVFWLSLVYAV